MVFQDLRLTVGGVCLRLQTPPAIIRRFGAEFAASLREERVSKQLIETQQLAIALNGSEELRTFLAAQMKQWGAVVRENGIRGDG